MREEACKADIFTRPSWGCEVTYETIPISVANQYPQLHSEVLNIFFQCAGEIRGENTKHPFHSSWGRKCVNLIF